MHVINCKCSKDCKQIMLVKEIVHNKRHLIEIRIPQPHEPQQLNMYAIILAPCNAVELYLILKKYLTRMGVLDEGE